MRTSRLVVLAVLSFAAGMIPMWVGAQRGDASRAASTAPAAADGEVCIDPQTAARAVACPSISNGERNAATKNGPPAPSSHLQTSKRRQEEKKQGPGGPGYVADENLTRGRARLQARAEQLLTQEITLTRRLVTNTRQDDPRRPEVLLRLAETYFELQQALNTRVRSYDEPIFQACETQKNTNACRDQRQGQQQAEQQLNEARRQSIAAYADLVQSHPTFRRMDEVIFSLGFALEEMREFERAREAYSRLIKNFPQSRFVPNAYLSFAEYYFAQGEMENARAFYEKVIEIPPDRNPVYGYAVYKMGWVNYNLDDFRGSLQKFVETIEYANQNPEAPDVGNLAKQARRELVLPYARVGTPDRALDFFRRYARDEAQAIEMFENLGELYFDTGDWPNTMRVYHGLMSAQPNSDKLCYWQTRVLNAVISSKPKPDQVREIERTVDLYDVYTRPSGQAHSAESVAQCKQSLASTLVELSTAWHREAVGTEQQPGTNDRNTMNLASSLYRNVLAKFPELDSMEFPEMDRRDWPTTYRVSYFLAELTWKMEDWGACGPAFDRVVELNPQGEYTSDAAYGAVLCYNNLYQQQYQASERQTRNSRQASTEGRTKNRRGRQQEAAPEDPHAQYRARELTAQEQGMINAMTRYACLAPDSEELPQVKYRRARIYYETNHYEEAATLFKDIAWNHRTSELAEYAANLYLDSLNILGTHSDPARPSCFEDMGTAVDQLKDMYCDTEEHKTAHAELCGQVLSIRCDIKRKGAEAKQSRRMYTEAAAAYVEIYRECQADPTASARMDEVLWNAAINYEAAYSIGKAIRVRKRLVDRFPDSNLAKRALFLIGESFRALAMYSDSANYYEQFAQRYPQQGEGDNGCAEADRAAGLCTIAHEALDQAVVLRIGLGDTEKAIEDVRLYERNYRTRHPRETARVVYALGSIYENQRDWTRIANHYKDWLRNYGRSGLPNQVIRANVMIARAYLNANNASQAAPFVTAAITAWDRGAPAAIAALEGFDDRTKEKYLVEAKIAVSEAIFLQAEGLYQTYAAMRFPEFRGNADMASVTRWSQRDFAPWFERKVAALRAAETAYQRLDTEAVRVPQWLIAGASRIGQLYTALVDGFDDAPVPREIENDPDLYQAYVGELNRQREIFFQQAIPKFQFCLQMSTRLRWFNDYSRTCESELNRLNPTEYPIAQELRGEPRNVYRDFARPGAVDLNARAQEEETESSAGGAQ